MNYNKLKGKMKEKEKTYRQVADALGMSLVSFSGRMNKRTVFDINELQQIGDFLGLTLEERAEIFLT